MIKQLDRILNGIYYSANNNISFTSNPFITANSKLNLWFVSNDSRFSALATAINGNNVAVNFVNAQYNNESVTIHTPCFGGGLTGVQPKFSFSNATTPATLLQATVYNNGATNTANVAIQVSSDDIGWIPVSNIMLTSANTSGFIYNQLPWAYARLNIIDISPGSILQVSKVN